MILQRLLTQCDADGTVDRSVSVDATINRAHQHAPTIPCHTGGFVELHVSAHQAGWLLPGVPLVSWVLIRSDSGTG